jgi:hypothetical protein
MNGINAINRVDSTPQLPAELELDAAGIKVILNKALEETGVPNLVNKYVSSRDPGTRVSLEDTAKRVINLGITGAILQLRNASQRGKLTPENFQQIAAYAQTLISDKNVDVTGDLNTATVNASTAVAESQLPYGVDKNIFGNVNYEGYRGERVNPRSAQIVEELRKTSDAGYSTIVKFLTSITQDPSSLTATPPAQRSFATAQPGGPQAASNVSRGDPLIDDFIKENRKLVDTGRKTARSLADRLFDALANQIDNLSDQLEKAVKNLEDFQNKPQGGGGPLDLLGFLGPIGAIAGAGAKGFRHRIFCSREI